MSSSFGKWYEEKKNEEHGDTNSSGNSWFDTESLLPMFNTENMQPISWSNMKASMEKQMPSTILGMGYQQRFQVFCGLLFLSILFFALAFFIGVPMLAVKPHKFAISFTCGSLTFMGSFGILRGPMEHMKSMLQSDRLLFTTLYFGSMFMTLYCTFFIHGITGYLCVVSSSAIQLIALIWYLISFLPGGTSGLSYVFAAMAHILKPVLVACARFQAACMTQCLSWMANRATSST
jgi:hypothetical protein